MSILSPTIIKGIIKVDISETQMYLLNTLMFSHSKLCFSLSYSVPRIPHNYSSDWFFAFRLLSKLGIQIDISENKTSFVRQRYKEELYLF